MSNMTFFWHDYETFGVNPSRDQPAQFAGQRTDSHLNPTGPPVVLYCVPTVDRLPSPQACLVNGITPQVACQKGIIEMQFIARILAELSAPGTCSVGYNSIRFDDEMTRHTLFRNFHDPYVREWKNGCSRWDIIDLVRMAAALRPEGIQWPEKADGSPSFQLVDLAEANGLAHEEAHDALSDVQATIALAHLLQTKQSRLFNWLLNLRQKKSVIKLINSQVGKPLVHTHWAHNATNRYTSLVLPLRFESRNRSSLLVYDLRVDPAPFLDLSWEELHQRLYLPIKELGDPSMRLPVSSLKINQSPAVAPVSTLDDGSINRIGLDMTICLRHQEKISDRTDFADRVEQAVAAREFLQGDDVDESLYNGFLNDHDRNLCQRVVEASPMELATGSFPFHDERLPELLFRYRARNWPDTLNATEKEQWQLHCQQRLEDPTSGLEPFFESLAKLRVETGDDPSSAKILDDLEAWVDSLVAGA